MAFLIVVLLVAGSSCRSEAQHLQIPEVTIRSEAQHPQIPEVTITVYQPRGIKIGILSGFGIHSFNFEAKINNEKIIYEELDAYVPQNQTKEWVLKDENIHVEIGDKLHYYMFIFTEIYGFAIDKTVEINETHIFKTPEILRNQTNDGCNYESFENYYNAFRNLTKTAKEWQNQVEKLNGTVGILKNIVKRMPKVAKCLRMNGKIPPDANPLSFAQDVVRQKLRLTTKLMGAVRNADGSITFSVATLEDKIEILVAVETKMRDSQIRIY